MALPSQVTVAPAEPGGDDTRRCISALASPPWLLLCRGEAYAASADTQRTIGAFAPCDRLGRFRSRALTGAVAHVPASAPVPPPHIQLDYVEAV